MLHPKVRMVANLVPHVRQQQNIISSGASDGPVKLEAHDLRSRPRAYHIEKRALPAIRCSLCLSVKP